MSPEEKISSHDDSDQLDALWATFRLPIPISSPAREGKHDNGDDPSSGHDDWLLELLDLFRLLQTMDHQYKNSAQDQNRARTSRVMNSQVALAYSTLWRVERTCPFSPCDAHENKAEENSDRIFQRRIHILLQKARSRTEETCTRLKSWLDRPYSHPAKRHQKEQMPRERDMINDIFLAPATPSSSSGGEDESELLDELSVDVGGDDNEDTVAKMDLAGQGSTHAQSQRHLPRIPPPEELDPVNFQKQQQELLEEELASMASRLKSSTLAMNATLQSQTKELDEMEQLAQTNLDQVTDTTTKVEARLANQRGWKKQLVTWSMIGTVIGMWALCFMVMRTVPKRKIGTMNLTDRFRDGKNLLSLTLNRYFSKDEGEIRSGDGKTQWQKQQTRWHEWGQGYWQRQEEHHRTQQECEVINDGTTTCYNSQDVSERIEKVVHEIAAEHKQHHIVENMANVPIVDAVESGNATDEKDAIHDAGTHDQTSDDNQDRSHISDNPMECIPPTEELIKQQTELDSLRVALIQLENAIDRLPVGSTERLQMSKEQDELQAELNNLSSVFELERDKAMSINVKGRGTASGSFFFCEGEVLVGEFSYHEENRDAEQARSAENMHEPKRLVKQAELERREKERTERAKAERVKQERLAEVARIEFERLEQERLAALIEQERILNEEMEQQKEASRLVEERLVAEAERLRQQKRAEEEAERSKQERLAEAARIEVDRLEQERLAALIEQERVLIEEMEEQKEAARLEEEKLVAEAERLRQQKRAEEEAMLQAEELEKQRLAALEASKKAEIERLEEERLATTTAELEDENLSAEAERSKQEKLIDEAVLGAKKAIDLALQIAADNTDFLPSDVRFAAGQQKNDLLAHYISVAPGMVDDSDKSGWRPIHEAARAGNLAGIQLLVSAGCDLASRTGRKGNGGTALWWAIQRFGEDHGAAKLLRYHGALYAGPES
jgi:hypothetical protein